jgi:hypothetical protein
MKRTFLAATAAVAALGVASSASAMVTMTAAIQNDLFGTTLADHSQVMLYNFDDVLNPSTDYVGNVLQGPQGGGTSASPPYNGDPLGDTTKYASVQANTTGTFSALPGFALTSFSFYIGSPDDYNHLTFNFVGGGSQAFDGPNIWGGPSFGGDRTKGYRVYYDFGGAQVQSVTFSTESTNAFEFDGIGGTVAAIPEPGTWALMILGFGGAGAMLRSRRSLLA